MRRVLITGSRTWTDRAAVNSCLNEELLVHEHITVIHGGARGADTIAAEWCAVQRALGAPVKEEVYPVSKEEWQRYGKRAGYRRNAMMVNTGADICYAFPLGPSNGTRGCMGLAKSKGIRVVSAEAA